MVIVPVLLKVKRKAIKMVIALVLLMEIKSLSKRTL